MVRVLNINVINNQMCFKKNFVPIVDVIRITAASYWCRPAGTLLGLYHRLLVLETDTENMGWLEGTICNAASAILRRDYPFVSGLESPLGYSLTIEGFVNRVHQLRMSDLYPMKPPRASLVDTEKIQILNSGGNHWVTIRAIVPGQQIVEVYDSLHLGVNIMLAMQIAAVIRFPPFVKNFSTITPAVMRQKNNKDCGIHAIAFALTACQKKEPESQCLLETKVKYFKQMSLHWTQ